MSGTELDSDGTNSYHPEHPWEQVGHALYIEPSRRTKANGPPERVYPAGPAEALRWSGLPDHTAHLKSNWFRLYGPTGSGATLMGDLAAFPSNAGEFAARWNDATPAQRDDLVSRLVGMQQEANRCFEGDHRTQIERLRSQLAPMQRLLMDLDRSPHGRHQGDAEGQDPTGTSQGNPHLTMGQVIGHDIGGRPYIVPEPHLRGDASAWQTPRPQSQVASTGEAGTVRALEEVPAEGTIEWARGQEGMNQSILHRVVSTVAELDALPTRSVVMDGDGEIWRKSNALWDCLDLNGDQPREESKTVLWQSREPQATVLWVGGTE